MTDIWLVLVEERNIFGSIVNMPIAASGSQDDAEQFRKEYNAHPATAGKTAIGPLSVPLVGSIADLRLEPRGRKGRFDVEDVQDIRAAHAHQGATYAELAEEYAVNPETIRAIVMRKSYAWVEE